MKTRYEVEGLIRELKDRRFALLDQMTSAEDEGDFHAHSTALSALDRRLSATEALLKEINQRTQSRLYGNITPSFDHLFEALDYLSDVTGKQVDISLGVNENTWSMLMCDEAAMRRYLVHPFDGVFSIAANIGTVKVYKK